MSDKQEFTVELKPRQFDYLNAMVAKYDLPNPSKALRCLIDHAIESDDAEASIFTEIRCLDC